MKLFKVIFRSRILFIAFFTLIVSQVQAVSFTVLPANLFTSAPRGIQFGSDGNLWSLLHNNPAGEVQVARITPNGIVDTFSFGAFNSYGWPSYPQKMRRGTDGNMWILVQAYNPDTASVRFLLFRVTPSGIMTEIPLSPLAGGVGDDWANDITAGPDGNMWVVGSVHNPDPLRSYESKSVVWRITPSGEVSQFSIMDGYTSAGTSNHAPENSYFNIAPGPDGNVWVGAYAGAIWKVTPAGEFSRVLISPPFTTNLPALRDMTLGTDGNMWGMNFSSSAISRITPSGEKTEFKTYSPWNINYVESHLTGLDGNVWYSAAYGFGRITPAGEIKEFSFQSTRVHGITIGPDGELWFADSNRMTIGHTIGVSSVEPVPPVGPACNSTVGSLACENLGTQCPPGFASPNCTQAIDPKNLGDRPQSCEAMATKPQAGNPVDIGGGNKIQIETDYASPAPSPLALTRSYNSRAMVRTGLFGTNTWRSTFDRSIKFYQKNDKVSVAVFRPDGKILYFNYNAGQFTTTADIADKLTLTNDANGQPNGYSFLSGETGDTETYNNAGRITKITARNGVAQDFTYDGQGRLTAVTDSFGKTLGFAYDAQNRVDTVTDPGNGVYKYAYDASGNIKSVTYPGDVVRQYVYEDPNLANALTGIIDENNKRFATWTYDAQGRATGSEHAGGVEKTTLVYNADSTQVTDTLNTTRTYNFETVLGVVRSKGQSQPGGAGCNAASNAITYDANGNLASRTDFNGNITTYVYDLTRNLETKRVEAFGTPQARTISTAWHPTYRLPTAIAEPQRRTAYDYDDKGNLLKKSVRVTNDTNGSQGLNVVLQNTVLRSWSYTYNGYGQVLTVTGPRDAAATTAFGGYDAQGKLIMITIPAVVDKTTYAYDAQGNLITITNAAGHITTLSNYDAHGRAGRITDPNGLVTDLSYSPRGWLTSRTVGGETTAYEYDGVGQLKKVTFPDNATIAYTYDDAHRLTDVVDSLGNAIHYTLDGMGNRIKEETKDPDGTLTRQITRVYDALNRLQQVTGAQQ